MCKSSLSFACVLVALGGFCVFGEGAAVPGNGKEDCVRVDARCANGKACNLAIYLASLPNQGFLEGLTNVLQTPKTVCGKQLLPGNAFATHINEYDKATFYVPRGTTLKASAGLLSAVDLNSQRITIEENHTEISCITGFWPIQCSESFYG